MSQATVDAGPSRGFQEERRPLAERLGFTFERPGPWLWLPLLWLAAFSLFPFFFAIYRSLFEFDSSAGQFVYEGLGNWSKLIHDPRIWNALWVTCKYVIFGLTVELVLGFAIAMLFEQAPRGVGFFRTAMILPMVVPPAIAGLMFQLLEHASFGPISLYSYKLGLMSPEQPLLGGTGKHAMLAILLPDIWQWTPFMALIILAGMRALPSDPFEAASVDGASAWQRFRFLTLPMLKPVIAIAVLLRALDAFKVFEYVFATTRGGPGNATETIQYQIYRTGFQFFRLGEAAAMAFVLVAVVLLLVTLLYRRIMRQEAPA